MSERMIFREKAIQAYRRSSEKDVLPRYISWPIVAGSWLLLGIFIAIGYLAWNIQVPAFASGTGMIRSGKDASEAGSAGITAIVFLQPDQFGDLHPGQRASVQVGSTGASIPGRVSRVEPGILSPATARQLFRLDAAEGLLVTQPSAVVLVRLDPSRSQGVLAGSLVQAKIEIGAQRLLRLLPDLGSYLGIGA